MLVKKNAHVGLDISNKTWQRPKIYLVNVTWDPQSAPRWPTHGPTLFEWDPYYSRSGSSVSFSSGET